MNKLILALATIQLEYILYTPCPEKGPTVFPE